MSENYAVINGKRVELTDEQLKALGIERKNPFERVNYNEAYYFVKKDGSVSSYTNANDGGSGSQNGIYGTAEQGTFAEADADQRQRYGTESCTAG